MAINVLSPKAGFKPADAGVRRATQEDLKPHEGMFGRLLENTAARGNSLPPEAIRADSLRDRSLVQLAASESIDFAQLDSKGPAFHELALNHLTTALYLKFFSAQDQAPSTPLLGLRLGMGASALNQRSLLDQTPTAFKGGIAVRSEAELGALSAQFESGKAGVASIGYDRTGGTSYGTYQISSRQGTLSRFLQFLEGCDARMAARLREAGPGNTGSNRGAFPDEWKRIAQEDPEYFETLQHRFIRETHYEPAVAEIRSRTGVDLSRRSPTVQQVLWSTAVQHGPQGAAAIFEDALKGHPVSGGEGGNDLVNEKRLIDRVYALRSTRFGSSSSEVQAAVLSRFKQEKQLALNMLQGDSPVG